MSNLIFSAELAHDSLRTKLDTFSWAIDSTEKFNPDEGIYKRLVHDFLLVKTLFVGKGRRKYRYTSPDIVMSGHSVAEDTIILPRLKCRTVLPKEFDDDHNEEENLFGEMALALKKIHPRHQDQTEYDDDIYNLRRLVRFRFVSPPLNPFLRVVFLTDRRSEDSSVDAHVAGG